MLYFIIILRIDYLEAFDPGKGQDLLFGAGDQYLTWRAAGQYLPQGAICAALVKVEGEADQEEPGIEVIETGEAEFGGKELEWIESVAKSAWLSRGTDGFMYLHSKYQRVLSDPRDWEELQRKLELIRELTTVPPTDYDPTQSLVATWDRLKWNVIQQLRFG